MSRFREAVRQQAKLRLALDGPSGSGKSYTALRFAHCFPNARIAAIEAGENNRLPLYVGEKPDGIPFHFQQLCLQGNYAPSEYTAAIEEAGRDGFDVLIIDSLSHAWSGAGGALEQVGDAKFTDRNGWRTVTPQHNRLIDAILQSPCHVIVTMRTKTEYIIEEVTDERGRTSRTPRKIGLAPIQRPGMEYEFDLYASMERGTITVSKSRCSHLQGAIAHYPGAGFMSPLLSWLTLGSEAPKIEVARVANEEQVAQIKSLFAILGMKPAKIVEGLAKYNVDRIERLKEDQAEEVITKLEAAMEKRQASRQEKETPASSPNHMIVTEESLQVPNGN